MESRSKVEIRQVKNSSFEKGPGSERVNGELIYTCVALQLEKQHIM